MEENKLRGAKPSCRHKLAAAEPFKVRDAIPLQVAYIPSQLSYWGNNQYGDCVTAEEAFNKAASGKFLSDSTITNWASRHNYLNGAMLTDVMDTMATSGLSQDGHLYGDGAYKSVDYSNEAVLQSALSLAPVKIGIDANALPSSAGGKNGWYKLGGRPGQFGNTDHCVALAGYGPASFLFAQLGVALPSGIDGTKVCYLLFTWSSIGVVDHDWIMSTVSEAWLRNPSTLIDGAPQPNPGPPPAPPIPPAPPTPPTPVPVPGGTNFTLIAIIVGVVVSVASFFIGRAL